MIRPLYDRVVVRRTVAEEKTASNLLFLPEVAKEKPALGTVLAVGNGKFSEAQGVLIPLQTAIGDSVLFGKYSGTEFDYEGETLVALREEEIIGIL
jgi:chaperonin GroES